jgi:hypothetical protein
MRLFAVVCAVAGLAAIDYVLLSVSYLYQPKPAEWLLGVAFGAFALGVVLRLGWLILAVQAIITAILLYRLLNQPSVGIIRTSGSDTGSWMFILGVLAIALAIAWLAARAVSTGARRWW